MCHVERCQTSAAYDPKVLLYCHYCAGTNRHLAVTTTRIVCSPGSTGVEFAMPWAAATRNTGRGPASPVLSSSRVPKLPPAARAIASASPRAAEIASASACRLPTSELDE